MEKLDRLGWAAGMSFVSYGVPIGLRVNVPEALDRVLKRLPPEFRIVPSRSVQQLYSVVVGGSGGGSSVKRFNVVYAGPTRIARMTDPEEAFHALESDLHLYVAEHARRRVFVHAGVVGWRGRAVVIPGRSLSGKSTLVAALIRAGAVYYSDEYAVLDDLGRVHAYPAPLSIREGPGKPAHKYPPSMLRPAPKLEPMGVGLAVVTRYRQGARFRPRSLSPGHGLLALLANTVAARRKPEASMAVLNRIANVAPVVRGVRGEAEEAAGRILELLDAGERR